MLRDLFPRDHRRYEESRYGDELESFATWLSQEGHLRYPLRLHIHRAKTVLERSEGLQSGLLRPSLLKAPQPSISRYPSGAFKKQSRKDRVTSAT